MSELQIGLIALGVILIIVVLSLNWWQDRRIRRRMQDQFAHEGEDPLLGDAEKPVRSRRDDSGSNRRRHRERREPEWRTPAQIDPVNPDGRLEPGVTHDLAEVDDHEEPDARTEAVIDIVFVQPVAAEDLMPLVRDVRQAGRKMLRVFYRTTRGVHCARLRLGEQYASMQIAVLLANRSGVLTPTEWAQAWAQAQRIADAFDAEVEGPDPKEVSQRATELDALCASLDTSVSLTVKPRGGAQWREPQILAAARSVGFSDQPGGGELHWLDENNAVRFSLMYPQGGQRNSPQYHSISLLLDVPRSPAVPSAFADMADVGRMLARKLDGELVDDNGLPLAEGCEAAVDTQLRQLYAELEKAGFTSGSSRALRVFA